MSVNVNGELVPLSRVTLLLERTVRDLASVTRADDARDLVDRVAAIRDLARRAKAGVAIENGVTALRVKAEMRMAELVDEGQERGEIATVGTNQHVRGANTQLATLPELGISAPRLTEARTLARYFSPAVVDGAAREATANGAELSRQSLLREARTASDGLPDPRTDEQRHTSSFERLLSAVRDVGTQLERIELTPGERDRVVGLLDGCRRRLGGNASLEVVA